MSSLVDRRHELLGEVVNEMARLIAAAEQVRTAAGTRNRTARRPSAAGSLPWATDRIGGQRERNEHRQLIEDIAQASTFATAADEAFADLLTSVTASPGPVEFGRDALEITHLDTDLDALRELQQSLAADVHSMQELYTRITDVVGG